MLAKCDECAAEFDVEFQITTTKEIEKTSFFCPECHHEYVAYVKNDSIKRQQADIKKLYSLMRKRGVGQEQQSRLMKHIKFLEKKVKIEMDELKKQHI